MSNAGNQIRNKMIQSYPKTDRQKLVGIRTMLTEKYPRMSVTLEPYMLFTKGEDEYQGWYDDLREDQVKEFLVQPTDIVLRFTYKKVGREIFFELDGAIHDIKVEKTNARNKRYRLNNLEYFIVNERDLKFKLGIAKSAVLPQEEINKAFLEGFNKILATPRQ